MKKLNPGTIFKSQLKDKLANFRSPDIVTDPERDSVLPRNGFDENEQFHTLFELSPDVIVQADPDGKIRMINSSCLDFFGYLPQEMIGRSILDFYVDAHLRNKMLELVGKFGYVRNFRAEMKSKGNAIKIASINARFCYDQSGNVTGIDTLIRDDTEKIKAKQEIAKSKDFYETILN